MIDLDEKYDLLYYIRISTSKRVWVEEEAFYKVKNGKTSLTNAEKIFRTKQAEKDSGDIRAEYADKIVKIFRRFFTSYAKNRKKEALLNVICNLPENEVLELIL